MWAVASAWEYTMSLRLRYGECPYSSVPTISASVGLKANGGGFEITCYEDFANAMEAFFADKPLLEKAGEAAGRYVQGLAGASQKILDRVSL